MKTEESYRTHEKILFSMLAVSHLEVGGAVGFRGRKWYRHLEPEGDYINVDERGEVQASWKEAVNAIQALVLEISRERKNYDDVYFYFPDGTGDGVTWRMLKIDMSFLRIVLEGDDLTMREIIRRFVRISEDVQKGSEEPFKNLN